MPATRRSRTAAAAPTTAACTATLTARRRRRVLGTPPSPGTPPPPRAPPRARPPPSPGTPRVGTPCLRKERGKPLAPFARAAAALPAEARTTRSRLEQYGILRHPAIPRQKGISCVAAL